MAKQTWTVQLNDLIGGFIVTDYPHPLSDYDTRPEGDKKKRGVIACECISQEAAEKIAQLLNEEEYEFLSRLSRDAFAGDNSSLLSLSPSGRVS